MRACDHGILAFSAVCVKFELCFVHGAERKMRKILYCPNKIAKFIYLTDFNGITVFN